MLFLNQYSDLILLSGMLLILLSLWILWFRQSGALRDLREQGVVQREATRRLEELVQAQGLQQQSAMTQEGEKRREEIHNYQQRQLLQISKLYQALERRFGEMQKATTEENGALRLSLSERLDSFHQGLERALAITGWPSRRG